MHFKQHSSEDVDLAEVLQLIQTAFAYMDERIDPPSSMHRLSIRALADQCNTGEIWSMHAPRTRAAHQQTPSPGNQIVACMALKEKADALYMGKLSVASTHRNQGLGTRMIQLAEQRANSLGKAYLELETRIELLENHAYFEKRGFIKTGEGKHDGYQHPTYLVMRKPASARSH